MNNEARSNGTESPHKARVLAIGEQLDHLQGRLADRALYRARELALEMLADGEDIAELAGTFIYLWENYLAKGIIPLEVDHMRRIRSSSRQAIASVAQQADLDEMRGQYAEIQGLASTQGVVAPPLGD